MNMPDFALEQALTDREVLLEAADLDERVAAVALAHWAPSAQ